MRKFKTTSTLQRKMAGMYSLCVFMSLVVYRHVNIIMYHWSVKNYNHSSTSHYIVKLWFCSFRSCHTRLKGGHTWHYTQLWIWTSSDTGEHTAAIQLKLLIDMHLQKEAMMKYCVAGQWQLAWAIKKPHPKTDVVSILLMLSCFW